MQRPGLTSTATLARGTAWNIAGRLLPLVVALAATPFLIDALGLARWGLFTLAFGLAGIFGVLDFGIGRALTRQVAAAGAGGASPAAVAGSILAGLRLLGGLGVIVGLACAGGTWAYADHLPLAPELREEARWAFVTFSFSAPLILVNAGLWGVLAAHQRFASANLANVPILILYYVGPLVALRAWDSLAAAMLVLVACRVAMTWAYWRLCLAELPALRTARPDRDATRLLLRQGGWMMVTAVIAPAAQQLDRFIIAVRLSADAAAHFATPFDLIIRIAVLGQAVLAGAFPAMAAALAGDRGDAGRLFRHATLAILALVLPPSLTCLLFADVLLGLWLGAEFAAASAPATRFLAAGVVLFALDGVTAALIDGAARAARNAMLALAELALYLPAMMLALSIFGIAGAAAAWALRMLLTSAARLALASRAHSGLAPELRALAPALLATLAGLAIALALATQAPLMRLALLPVLLAPTLWLAWRHGLTTEERDMLRARVALARLTR